MTCTTRDLREIYQRDEKIRREDVAILQEWLKKQHHLPPLEELQVILFLHSCYYSVEAAKKTIDIYFTKRTHLGIFHRLEEEDMRAANSVALITVLPKRTPQGYTILLLKLLDSRLEKFNFAHLTRFLEMISSLYIYHNCPLDGVVVVLDNEGATLAHLTKINLLLLKQALDYLQEGAPVRIKGLHFINSLAMLDKLLMLIKPFLSKELYGLICAHSSMETFYKYVPRECLPEEYGGDAPSFQILQEANVKFLLNNAKLLEVLDSLTVDETKRVNSSTVHGIAGTFRKLDID